MMTSFKVMRKRRLALGDRIRQKREAMGMSRGRLARLSGLTISKVAHTEQGLRPTDAATELVDLAEGLETTPSTLLENDSQVDSPDGTKG